MNTRSKMASCSNRETSAANAAVNVDYHQFFTFPDVAPKKNEECKAKCKLCHKTKKPYKYTLTTKGNLLKHLQIKHKHALARHKEEQRQQLRLNESSQTTLSLSSSGTLVRKQIEFRKQDAIVTSAVRNLCGAELLNNLGFTV